MKIEDTDDMEQMRGITVSRDWNHAHEKLIARYKRVAKAFAERNPGKTLLVTCTYRSPEYQQKLFKKGRFGNPGPIVTQLDGKNKLSKHNAFPSLALDVCVLFGGKAVWDEREYWDILPLCEENNLVSGGKWSRFPDWPHIQLPEEQK